MVQTVQFIINPFFFGLEILEYTLEDGYGRKTLQPSPMKKKGKWSFHQTSKNGHVPVVNLPGCIGLGGRSKIFCAMGPRYSARFRDWDRPFPPYSLPGISPGICLHPLMGVSENRSTPKWMVKIMENPMNKWMIWGAHPYFLETPFFRIWVGP